MRFKKNPYYVEKGLSMHMQRMLEMSRCLYTGGNIGENLEKIKLKFGTILTTIYDLVQNIFLFCP